MEEKKGSLSTYLVDDHHSYSKKKHSLGNFPDRCFLIFGCSPSRSFFGVVFRCRVQQLVDIHQEAGGAVKSGNVFVVVGDL